MSLQQLKKSLIAIADKLDRDRHYVLADRIDREALTIIAQLENQEPQSEELEIPLDEKLMLDDVLKSLKESLNSE